LPIKETNFIIWKNTLIFLKKKNEMKIEQIKKEKKKKKHDTQLLIQTSACASVLGAFLNNVVINSSIFCFF